VLPCTTSASNALSSALVSLQRWWQHPASTMRRSPSPSQAPSLATWLPLLRALGWAQTPTQAISLFWFGVSLAALRPVVFHSFCKLLTLRLECRNFIAGSFAQPLAPAGRCSAGLDWLLVHSLCLIVASDL
jgi:hypothetical protein